jgi:esterase/lipase superfamily enzyme
MFISQDRICVSISRRGAAARSFRNAQRILSDFFAISRGANVNIAILIALFLLTSFGELAAAQQVTNRSVSSALDAKELLPLPGVTMLHRLLYFATNRKIDGAAEQKARALGSMVGSEDIFLNSPAVLLAYGYVDASSPPNRTIGQQNFQSDSSKQRPSRDFSLWEHHLATGGANELRETIDHAGSNEAGRALLYVHGLDNSFHDAAERLAQLTLDLDLKGPPLLFSWPSDSFRVIRTVPGLVLTPNNYKKVDVLAALSERYLAQMMKELLKPNAYNIISHSIGAKLTANALVFDSPSDALVPRLVGTDNPLTNLLLAAPDISTKEFSEMRLTLLRKVRRVTVYCSDDHALSWSSWVNGSDDRLGYCKKSRASAEAMEGIDFVRVFGALGDWVNHSYYLNSWEVLEDIKKSLSESSQDAPLPGVLIPNRDREIFRGRR